MQGKRCYICGTSTGSWSKDTCSECDSVVTNYNNSYCWDDSDVDLINDILGTSKLNPIKIKESELIVSSTEQGFYIERGF